ncbi:protein FAR-RED IMPAIRED RESPONSE 1-like [Hevea brasiliensis]|uniref:protein FAR-RED IMPAIRED RESPONSE 1-like n=1 Tax=Hevea brasiliensis TaxID=3981 RepID=UPI0025CCA081|nr:protein FAR-RED IMPAIRED RESPONSE 1-like [Hevea brasiliensis]
MQRNDPEFFYSFDLDDDSRLSNVLWVHPRSRVAYEEFNDVVSFDTTYLVNRYKLPFATIVGVNHHGQSILLGCALILHENVNTFKWLFMTWLEVMGDVHPNFILTNQCESMRKAIREVMPNTRHRFCLGHILCNVPEKFKGVIHYDSACLEFKAIIYGSLTIEMFERNWNEFIVKHGLERNEWLSKLYVDRERWRKDVNRVHSKKFFYGSYPHMTKEFEKYREMERLFQEATDLAYDDNKIRFVKQRLAELKQDLLSWSNGMIAPTSNAQATIDTNNVDENEENERVILNPYVTPSRGRPRINRHRSVREITQ